MGKAVCYECGGTKTLEIVKDTYTEQPLIRSKCLKCGFTEDEWLFGDDPEYLTQLAQEYHVSLSDLQNAVNSKAKLPTQIQKTIYIQLKTLNPYFEKLYQIENIIALGDGRTVRLHHRSRRAIINIDITYDNALDTYQIKAYKLKQYGLDEQEIFNEKDFTYEQLDETIHQILHKHAGTPLQYINP